MAQESKEKTTTKQRKMETTWKTFKKEKLKNVVMLFQDNEKASQGVPLLSS